MCIETRKKFVEQRRFFVFAQPTRRWPAEACKGPAPPHQGNDLKRFRKQIWFRWLHNLKTQDNFAHTYCQLANRDRIES